MMTTPGARLIGTLLPESSSKANPGAKTRMHAATAMTAVNGAAKIPADE